MNHVYEGTLFQPNGTQTSTRIKNELEPRISYCHQNKVRTLDFIFVLSLCYLPYRLRRSIYL